MRKRRVIMELMILVFAIGKMTTLADDASVQIQTAKAIQQVVSESLTVYGSVKPAPDAIQTISLPHAGVVDHVSVRMGQRIHKGDPLLELTTAPVARAEFSQARNAVNYAERELARQEDLLKEQLTTKTLVDTAQTAVDNARANLKVCEDKGQDKDTESLTAPTRGIVTYIGVKQGDRVDANTAALSIASGKSLIAQLGVEPEDIHLLEQGTPVVIHSVFTPDYQAHSQILEIQGMINPSSHLVNAIVPIPSNQVDHLVLGSYLKADLQIKKHSCTTVPRSAVLDDTQGSYVFTVSNGKAKRINVETGQKNSQWVEITSGLKEGELVVSVGNYELSDGVAVREEK